MASFDDILSGAITGGTTGAAFGGIGAPVGALIGGLYGAFSKKAPPPTKFVDPNAAMQRQIANNLVYSQEGRQIGAVQGANAIRRADEEATNLEQDPALANNPIAKAAMRNKLIRSAEGTAVTAGVAGAESDRNAKVDASRILSSQGQNDYERFLNEEKMRREPTGLQMLAYQGIGSLAGKGASELGHMITPGQGDQSQGQGTEALPEWKKRLLELMGSGSQQDLYGSPVTAG